MLFFFFLAQDLPAERDIGMDLKTLSIYIR